MFLFLFIAFARPEYARKSFNAIKAAKPKKFYFYSNKGREGHGDELERNEQVRSMLKEVDWDCELHTWFRDECVDVYTSLWGAINWLFEKAQTVFFPNGVAHIVVNNSDKNFILLAYTDKLYDPADTITYQIR